MRFTPFALVALSAIATAHPGEHHEPEHDHLRLARRAHKASARRGLEACMEKRSYRELQERAIVRRNAVINFHGKKKRASPTGVGHNLTDSRSDVTASSTDEEIFGTSHTCILNPEGEIGPYYVAGELIREDLTDGEAGVPVIIDGQFIDVETCEVITDLYWDIWNCNSTGIYSGVVSEGNGNTADTSNINATFLRGIQKTDSDGVVQFQTVFPGHYQGRTNHHHQVAWLNATILPNNTLTSGYVGHIGQLFWDQDLIDAVEATYPYNTNTQSQTLNANDNVVSDETTNSDSDPFFNYVYLGDELSDGLFGWVTIGINKTASYATSYSFKYTSSGGVAVDNQSGGDSGGGFGTPSGGSDMPSQPTGGSPFRQ